MTENPERSLEQAASSTSLVGWLPIPVTLVVTLEAFRVLFPDLYGLKERTTLSTTLIVVALVVAIPFVTPILANTFGRRRSLTVALVVLAAWRAIVQVLTSVPVSVAALGAGTALVALTLALTTSDDGGAVSRSAGLVIGFAVDLTVMTAFATWDPTFQRSIDSSIVALAIVAALGASAMASHRATGWGEHAGRNSPSLTAGVAICAVIAIEVLFLANPGYLAAAAGTPARTAALIATLGLLGALGGTVAARTPRTGVFVAAVAMITTAGFLLPEVSGRAVVAVIWAGQIAAGITLGTALATRTHHPRRAELGLALGWAIALVALLLFQLHYDQPLPFDNRYVTAMLGLLTVMAGFPSAARRTRPRWRPAFVAVCACGLLAIAVATVTAASPPSVSVAPETIRLVQWNVRQAVDEQGRLDPAAIADGIDSLGDADIVVLNEIGRGWPLSGQLDAAGWLAQRLDMHMAWGGAASQQFGTLVLSRFPIESSDVLPLPHAGNSQGRSLLRITVGLGDGSSLDVLATHLQHRNDPVSMAARMEEIDVIVDEWNGRPATVLAGDLNPRQGDPPAYPPRRPGEFEEIAALVDAGWTTMSELDACRNPTSGSNCSDYVFVSPDLTQTEYDIGEQFSDHRMVVTLIER